MSDTTLTKKIYIAADPARVWAFLTEPDKLATWFHRPQEALVEGSSYEMRGTESSEPMMWGRVLTARPHEYLEYTFEIGPLQGRVTNVAFTLDPVPGGTRLTLEHTGLPEGEETFGLTLALDEGWDSHLGRLRTNAPEVEAEKVA